MKKVRLILATLLLLTTTAGNSQQMWNSMFSSRGNFGFNFPFDYWTKDTLGPLTYTAILHDSTVTINVNFIDSTAVYGNDELQMFFSRKGNIPLREEFEVDPSDPPSCYVDSIEVVLYNYAQMSLYFTQGTLEGYEPSDYSPCYIRGRELVIRHPNSSGNGAGGYYYTFTRYFYWNSKFLCFTVSGPENLIWDLYDYKSNLFYDVLIY